MSYNMFKNTLRDNLCEDNAFVIFDESESVNFESLDIGDKFIACDYVKYDGDNVIKYSQRTYCKLKDFFDDFSEKCNAISIEDDCCVYFSPFRKVIRVESKNTGPGD